MDEGIDFLNSAGLDQKKRDQFADFAVQISKVVERAAKSWFEQHETEMMRLKADLQSTALKENMELLLFQSACVFCLCAICEIFHKDLKIKIEDYIGYVDGMVRGMLDDLISKGAIKLNKEIENVH